MATPQPSPEALLAARCAAGDESAWRELVARYAPLLATLARRMLARLGPAVSEADVDEVVAEVFLALLRRERVLLARYDASFRLSTYLGVICRSEVGRWARRRGRAAAALPAASLAPASPEPGPPERLAEAERQAALAGLREALALLAPREQLLLTLRYLEGLPHAAIARALAVSPDSVGPLLQRARERLASRLPGLARLLDEA